MTHDHKHEHGPDHQCEGNCADCKCHDTPPFPPSNEGGTEGGSKLEREREEYLHGWKRALADYENLQKSIAANRQADHRRLVVDLAESLLPVIDNFGYVLKHIPDTRHPTPEAQKAFDTWLEGIKHIDRQFAESLKGLGVEPIEALGKKFDPHLHESGGSRKEEGEDSGTVVEELIKGWKVGDVVLRPAKVIVSE